MFCFETLQMVGNQIVALLSQILMQFVCLNTVLNPVIYGMSHKEFRLSFVRWRWPGRAGSHVVIGGHEIMSNFMAVRREEGRP